MNAIWLTLLVSSVLAGLGVGLFVWSARNKTRDHVDRLALLPLENDDSKEGGRS
ncbi:MAG TPA: cytochrome oxidase [Myxococcota bacterium]|nr:cytochrome oxidase [Myxococcota bacterium]